MESLIKIWAQVFNFIGFFLWGGKRHTEIHLDLTGLEVVCLVFPKHIGDQNNLMLKSRKIPTDP